MPKFGDNFYHKEAAVGVSLGLAYTQVGGEVLAIESTLVPTGSYKLVLTGKLGEVMKESAQAALSFVRASAMQFGFDPAVLDKNELHIHFQLELFQKMGLRPVLQSLRYSLSLLGVAQRRKLL